MAYLVRFKDSDQLESVEREMWARYRQAKLKAHGLPGPGIDRLLDGTPAPRQITTALVETYTQEGVPGGLLMLDEIGLAHLPESAVENIMQFGPEQLETRYARILAAATTPAPLPTAEAPPADPDPVEPLTLIVDVEEISDAG